ncbi:hypothetical protein [Nocardia terpenica]|nr:hypothetical protein [Nocardia terpenica]
MSVPRSDSTMIEGRVLHTPSTAPEITFRSGPGAPLATAVHNAASHKHRITYADKSVIWVESKPIAPTVITRGDGTAIGSVLRADTSTAVASTGGTLCHFIPHPDTPSTPDLFRLLLLDRSGNKTGRLEIIRTPAGWAMGYNGEHARDTTLWWDRTGPPLPVPILGTRLVMNRPIDRVERDILLAACVDMAIGLQPYVAVMK